MAFLLFTVWSLAGVAGVATLCTVLEAEDGVEDELGFHRLTPADQDGKLRAWTNPPVRWGGQTGAVWLPHV